VCVSLRRRLAEEEGEGALERLEMMVMMVMMVVG
jgi:hypothetical protein